MAIIPKNYARLESGYREKALKIYPWVCGRCSREFVAKWHLNRSWFGI